ncbi:MAG: hypothetical protein GX100_07025, partial [candidate division WS1 bacterium]|nr:hypothetical protein [candidate division WS1 bacterium]
LEYLRYENPANDQPLVCWQARQGGALVFYLVNVTPHTQRAVVTFAGQAGRLADLVSGATVGHGNTANVTVGAYMVLPLRVLGAEGVAGIQALPEPQRLAQLEAQVRFLQGLAPRAQGFTHVVSGAGEQYVTVKIAQEQYDDGPWGRRDVQETFDDLLQPILAAWKTGDYTQTDQLLTELAREHSWWYEALGWPPGEYRPRLPSGPYAEARELEAALTSPEPNSLGSHPLVPGESLSLPAGSASLREKMDAAGKYELVLWMVTGAGYGPVEVEVDGKASGQLGVGEGEPYFGHFTLLSPLPLLPGEHTLTLKGQGARSLVLSALELRLLPPEPIKRWSVIGLFDKGGTRDGWDGFDTVFPPEQEIDLQASYEGLGGQPARWQQIDLGEDKFIQLLERYFPYDYTKGNGVAYLATWVYSPEERNALLYYAFDWYSRIWGNDEVVVQQGSGPWRAFATVPVHLRAGWNKLLAKTSCGRSSWKANLALSDPGDLRYSPVPPS